MKRERVEDEKRELKRDRDENEERQRCKETEM